MATSFLDQNMCRAFPLVANTRVQIPDTLIVDCRLTVLQGSFDPAAHRMYLAWVARFGDRIRFGIRTDCPDLADEELVFEADANASRYTTLFARSTPSLQTVAERCGCGEDLVCNPGFGQSADLTCGDNLACEPGFANPCGPEQICNPRFQPEGSL